MRRGGARQLRLAVCLLLPGCHMITGACDYEVRSTSSRGVIVDDIREILRAGASVSARRGSSNWKGFSWSIVSPVLASHVVSVSLIDANQPGAILLRLALTPENPIGALGGSIEEKRGVEHPSLPLGGIFEIVAANRAILEITTDLPSQAVLRVPLIGSESRDWHRPDCQGWDDPSLKD